MIEQLKEGIIYIDYREKKNAQLAEKLALECQKPIEVVTLPFGDVIYNNLIFERKRGEDFRASLTDARLWTQLNGISSNGKACLLLSGSIEDDISYRVNPYQLLCSSIGALATCFTKYNVSVINLKEEWQNIFFIKSAINSFDRKGEKPVMFSKKQRSIKDIRSDMLTALDGISYNKAEKLLDHFGGSLRAVVLSDEKQLKEVEGIGKGISKSIVEVFR